MKIFYFPPFYALSSVFLNFLVILMPWCRTWVINTGGSMFKYSMKNVQKISSWFRWEMTFPSAFTQKQCMLQFFVHYKCTNISMVINGILKIKPHHGRSSSYLKDFTLPVQKIVHSIFQKKGEKNKTLGSSALLRAFLVHRSLQTPTTRAGLFEYVFSF